MIFETPYTYNPEVALETNVGRDQCIPCQATDLIDLVRRAQIGAILPDVYQRMDKGEDEDFDDAIDFGSDLVDYADNNDFIGRYYEKMKEAKKKASEALKPKDDTHTSTDTEKSEESPKNID